MQLRSKAHTPSREHNVPLFGTGTAFGTLSRATAIELGKDCFSILYALGGDASLAPELLIREYPLSPCNGMSKLAHPYKIQFKVPTRANQTTAYTVEQMADLLGSGLQQFRHLIQASKSECLLPQDATLLPSEHSLAALVLTFANCAQKAEQNAASHCNVNPRSWLDIAKVADTYVHALISHVLKTHTPLPDYRTRSRTRTMRTLSKNRQKKTMNQITHLRSESNREKRNRIKKRHRRNKRTRKSQEKTATGPQIKKGWFGFTQKTARGRTLTKPTLKKSETKQFKIRGR